MVFRHAATCFTILFVFIALFRLSYSWCWGCLVMKKDDGKQQELLYNFPNGNTKRIVRSVWNKKRGITLMELNTHSRNWKEINRRMCVRYACCAHAFRQFIFTCDIWSNFNCNSFLCHSMLISICASNPFY